MNNFYKIFNSKYDNILILWSIKDDLPKINRLYINLNSFKMKEIVSKNKEQSCNIIDKTISNINSFFLGKIIDFNLNILNLDICSNFQKQVILTEYNIPRGYVSTYKKISNFIQKPGALRAVGNALAKNPFPIVIPCHRAVRSDGQLGGYQGGIQMKYQLLKMEGIKFNKNNKVLFDQVYY